jgi:hypothetical protein
VTVSESGARSMLTGLVVVSSNPIDMPQNSMSSAGGDTTGLVGIVVAPRGRLQPALTLTIEREKIAEYELIADPTRLQQLDFAILDE